MSSSGARIRRTLIATSCDRIVRLSHASSAKAQKLDASGDRSTVYRAIPLMQPHGLIDELELMHIPGEDHHYQSGPGSHPQGMLAMRQDQLSL